MPKNNNLKDYLKDLYAGLSTVKPSASRDPQQFRSEIESLAHPADATATAADIRLNKTAYTSDGKVTGTIKDYDNTLLAPDGSIYTAPDGTKPIIIFDEIKSSLENRCAAIANNNYPYSISYQAVHLKGDDGMVPIPGTDGYTDVGKKHLIRIYFEVPESYGSNTVEVKLIGDGTASTNQQIFLYYLYSIDTPLELNTNKNNLEILGLFKQTGRMWNLKPLADRTITDNLAFNSAGIHFVDVLVNFYDFGRNDTGTATITVTVAKEV